MHSTLEVAWSSSPLIHRYLLSSFANDVCICTPTGPVQLWRLPPFPRRHQSRPLTMVVPLRALHEFRSAASAVTMPPTLSVSPLLHPSLCNSKHHPPLLPAPAHTRPNYRSSQVENETSNNGPLPSIIHRQRPESSSHGWRCEGEYLP